MKVEVVKDRRDETGIYLTLECSRDGVCVQKQFRMSGDKQDNGRTLVKFVREADRDIAVKLNPGKITTSADFDKYCDYKGPTWDGIPKDEFEKLRDSL